jgi:hypothetical protein
MRKNIVALALIPFLLMGAESSCSGGTSNDKVSDAKKSSAPEKSSAAPKPASDPLFAAKTYSGRGDKVLRVSLGDSARAAVFTHRGSANFVVTQLSASGEDLDIAINEIGHYAGTVLVNEGDDNTAALKIEADGRWTVTIKDLRSLPVWNGAATRSGSGDALLRIDQKAFDGLSTVKVTHRGSANFVVETYGDDSHDIPINEIGRYSGEVQLAEDTYLLDITADGAWTFTKTS